MTTRQYSHLFSCLYDQPEPVGSLGRGAHYSVFRTVQRRNISGEPCNPARIHDFAVIWDVDHDERIIKAAERLHLADLLWPVVFMGERKGTVSILLDYMGCADILQPHAAWLDKIHRVAAADEGDEWGVEFGIFHRMTVINEDTSTDPKRIINDNVDRVTRYLQGIDALWELGDREIT